MYQVWRNELGKVDAVNLVETGEVIPYWDEDHPLTLSFRTWLSEHPEFDMSDHEPASTSATPVPDWGQFRAQVLAHGAYFRIIGSKPQNQILNAPLTWALGEIGKNPDMISEVINLWGAIAYNASPTHQEIQQLNAIAEACTMPFRLDERGFMVPSV